MQFSLSFRSLACAACSTLMLSGTLAPAAEAAPIIQEVFYDATGPDAGDVFVELFADPGTSLGGWSLVGINGSTGLPYRTIDLTGAVFPSDGLLVIAQATANPALTAVRDFVGDVDWQNGPDAVQLIAPLAVLIDSLQYGDAGTNNAGFGLPAADAPSGSSLSRDLFGTNTGDNLADFFVGTPSPGIGPTPSISTVPEPSTLALLTVGTLPILVRRWWLRL